MTFNVLPVSEFAESSGLTTQAVRSGIKRGIIPVIRIGGIKVDVANLPNDWEDRLHGRVGTMLGRSLTQLVYFIGPESGPVKIGIATRPEARLAHLQCAHWQPLSILATTPGGAEQEREYHDRFAEHRLLGEWFARVPEIEAEMAYLERTKVAA